MKHYKAPKGFTRMEDEPNALIDVGAVVYLNSAYVAEAESPRRIVVMESNGTYLLADNKRMYAKGEGYLYGRYSIAYFKNPV